MKKKIAIAIEMIDINQPFLILDEPTTGLDSYQALQIITLLNEIKKDRNILFTIHQPRSAIVNLLENVIFISEGQLVFLGKMNNLLSHLENLGFDCGINYNPVDFMLDLISIDPNNKENTNERLNFLIQNNKFETQIIYNQNVKIKSIIPFGLYQLFTRSIKQIWRNRIAIQIKILMNLFLGILIGFIYFKKGRNAQEIIQNKVGVLYLTTTNQIFGTAFSVINIFVSEKNIVFREISKGQYNALGYYLSKIIADIPFQLIGPTLFGLINYFMVNLQKDFNIFCKYLFALYLAAIAAMFAGVCVSSFANTPEMASAIITPFNIIFFIFAGLFINLNNISKYLKWISKISYIKWCFEALFINEFKDTNIDNIDGNDVIKMYGFNHTNYYDCILYLCIIDIVLLLIGYFIFNLSKPKYIK